MQSLYIYKKGKNILTVVILSCFFVVFFIYFLTNLSTVAIAREEK